MYQNAFKPIVFKLTLKSENQYEKSDWKGVAQVLMTNYAKRISEYQEACIGHIKALLEVSDQCFCKFSCINALTGVNVEGNGEATAREVSLVINSLVAGVSLEESKKALELSWMISRRAYPKIAMTLETASAGEEESQHHEHAEGEVCPVCHGHHEHVHHHHHDAHCHHE